MLHESKSEVARLRRQIEDEYTAMQRGLSGLAMGTARHSVIAYHLRRVDRLRDRLASRVGEPEATQTVCRLYDHAMSQEEPRSTGSLH